MQTIAYLDCREGARGDTLLGALLDTGLSLEHLYEQLVAALPIEDYQLSLMDVANHHTHGICLKLTFSSQPEPLSSLTDIDSMLHASTLSQRARNIALTSLQRLVAAQIAVQQTAASTTPEPAKIPAEICVEIVAIAIALETLEINHLYASPLPMATGSLQTSTGALPNPSPVTLEILRPVHAPWLPCTDQAELVTPTAAALLATLADFETPSFTLDRVGYGYSSQSSTSSLRLYLGQAYPSLKVSDGGEADTDWVAVIESHIDNMSGELLGGLMERLFSLGAFDVSYTPMQMKKNRPATKVTVICPPAQGEYLSMVLLRETSTLGVRIQQVQRLKAQRSQQRIMTPLGEMLVKVKRLGGHIISATPEYEECQRIASAKHLPLATVYEVAQQAIQVLIIQA